MLSEVSSSSIVSTVLMYMHSVTRTKALLASRSAVEIACHLTNPRRQTANAITSHDLNLRSVLCKCRGGVQILSGVPDREEEGEESKGYA